jgi:hypothetical protein
MGQLASSWRGPERPQRMKARIAASGWWVAGASLIGDGHSLTTTAARIENMGRLRQEAAIDGAALAAGTTRRPTAALRPRGRSPRPAVPCPRRHRMHPL